MAVARTSPRLVTHVLRRGCATLKGVEVGELNGEEQTELKQLQEKIGKYKIESVEKRFYDMKVDAHTHDGPTHLYADTGIKYAFRKFIHLMILIGPLTIYLLTTDKFGSIKKKD